MNYVLAIASTLLILLAGDLFYSIIVKRVEVNHELELRFALAWALGTGLLSLAVFYLSLLDSRSAFRYATIFMATVAGIRIVGLFLKYADRQIIGNIRLRSTVIFVLLGLAITAIWTVAAKAGIGLDGTAHWGIKAKESFLHGGWRLFSQAYRSFPHSDYPLLIPTQQGWMYTNMGSVDEAAVKIVFVSFYLGLAALFYRAVRPIYHSLLAVVFTALMLSTPLLAISTLVAYADIPLMFFTFASIFFLWRWLQENNREDILLGSILAGIALLVKREGATFWLASFVTMLAISIGFPVTRNSADRLKQALVYPVSALLISGSWFAFLIVRGIGLSGFESTSIILLLESSDRYSIIAQTLGQQLFQNIGLWGILWHLFVLVTAWQWQKLKRSPILFVWLLTVIPLLAVSIGIVFSSDATFISHVATATPRLIMHTVPTAWFFIALSTTELDSWFRDLLSQRHRRDMPKEILEQKA